MSEHESNPVCATCHNLIDPIGYGFEKFDAVGARRDKYELRFYGGHEAGGKRPPPKTVTLSMDTNGFVAGIANSHFSLAARARRGAGQNAAVPGMHGEAILPVHGGSDGNSRPTIPSSTGLWNIFGTPISASKNL